MSQPDDLLRGHYILDGQEPIEITDIMVWGDWMQHNRCHVDYDEIGVFVVSTVFLAVDHSYGRYEKPMLFETMAWLSSEEISMTRCSTWVQAKRMHRHALQRYRIALLRELHGRPSKH